MTLSVDKYIFGKNYNLFNKLPNDVSTLKLIDNDKITKLKKIKTPFKLKKNRKKSLKRN